MYLKNRLKSPFPRNSETKLTKLKEFNKLIVFLCFFLHLDLDRTLYKITWSNANLFECT